ncbi:unnamed protein product [Mytilus edulis]|uniref:B box-type domain-containing protein n=1 Tax=Mytilus edulis TaxID=6550 RepID=A0A8S3R768_MYTED|nr:unnamed protein product [Mytilus edulis]
MSSPCCDGCSRIDKSTISIRFCMDCEESLCHECDTAHKTIKVLTTHQLVNLNALPTGTVKYLAAKPYSDKKICRFSSADKCTGSVDLGEKPWDIAIHSKSGKIVATLRSGSLQILENMEATTKFDILSDKLYGVAWINDDLVVGGKAEIYFLDSNMEHAKTLQIGANVIYYIHAKDRKVYLSDY